MTPQEILQEMMEGKEITEGILNSFLNSDSSVEGQYHDFKGGEITQKANLQEGRRTIRAYVSGFANSAGGLLVVGVADDRTISKCEDPIGQTPLDQWASRLLQDMAPYMSPPPRIQVLKHPDGPVLIIACPRSSSLVPCVDSGKLLYYLRIGDSTLNAPEYLISDLVLGYRRQPVIEAQLNREKSTYDTNDSVRLVFEVENMSFVRAENVRLGAVAYCHRRMRPRPVNRFLRSFVELGVPDLQPGLLVTRTPDMSHETPPQDILPFFSATIHLMTFTPAETESRNLSAGVFLSSDNGPTVWYQLTFNSDIAKTWTFVRMDSGRPYIGGID